MIFSFPVPVSVLKKNIKFDFGSSFSFKNKEIKVPVPGPVYSGIHRFSKIVLFKQKCILNSNLIQFRCILSILCHYIDQNYSFYISSMASRNMRLKKDTT